MRRLIGRITARRQQQSRGQSLVEFSLAVPLFLLLFVGIAEGGYYVAASTIVSNATHEGARLGVLEGTKSRGTIRTRVKESAAAIVSLKSSQIKLKLAPTNGDGTWGSLVHCNNSCYKGRVKDDRLAVTTSYAHTPLLGYVFSGITFPANAHAELIVEGDPV